MDWERVGNLDDNRGIFRSRVFGGWLVAMTHEYTKFYDRYDEDGTSVLKPEALTFVPDPEGKWKITKK